MHIQYDYNRRLGGEIAVERRPSTRKSFRFVRVVRAGAAKQRGSARGTSPPLLGRSQDQWFSSARPSGGGSRCPAVSRGVP
eukprot:6023465-Pyramimonas_sp.AAC.1